MVATKADTKTEILKQLDLVKDSFADQRVRLPKLSDRKGDLNKRWYVNAYFWDPVKMAHKRKQYFIPLNLTEKQRRSRAIRLIQVITQLIHEGYYIGDQIKEEKFNITYTLGSAVKYFLKVKKNLRKTTLKDYKSMCKKLLEYFGEDYDYRLVDRSKAIAFLDQLIAVNELNNRTRNNYMATCRTVFNFLKERGMVDENPFSGIKNLRTSKQQYHPFTDDQARRVFTYLEAVDPQMLLFCKCMYFTFARRNELRLLKVGNVDLENLTISIDKGVSKSHKARSMRIVPPLKDYLVQSRIQEWPDDYYVFGPQRIPAIKPYSKNALTDRFTGHLKKLDDITPGCTLYSWKHTGVRNAVMKYGVNIVTVQRMCGHKNIQQTAEYLRDLEVYVNTDMDKMQDL